MLCTTMVVGFLGRRPDEGAGHGNEFGHGQQGKYNEEENYSHGLLSDAR